MSDHGFANALSIGNIFKRRSKKRKRLRFILSKLFAYGFEEVAVRLGLPGYSIMRRMLFRRNSAVHAGSPLAVRVRLMLEELGPTFVKLGQVLSLRSDLLPDEITDELRKLQTNVAPFDGEDAVSIIEEDFGRPIEEVFHRFDREPIASASISQVHKAVTKAGRTVAVKIQRPKAIEIVGTDIALLHDLARLAARHVPSSRAYRPQEVIDQFDQTLATELDFYHEGRTMDLFRDLYRHSPGVYIPEVVWDLTTARVLTMEYLDGFGLERLGETKNLPFDRKLVARRGARYLLDQIFEHGIFNADPHPGNFIVLRDDVLAAVDFGMIGSVDTQMKESLLDAMEAFARREPEKLFRVFERLNVIGDEADTIALRHELNNIVNYYYNIPMAHVRADQILGNITAIIRRYQIMVPVDLILVFKVIITLESLGKQLDPDFNVVKSFRPLLIRRVAHRLDPRENSRAMGTFAEDLMTFARTFPYDISLVMRKLRSGKLRVQMEHQNLGESAGLVSRALNRLAFGIIITGILIGSSLLITLKSLPDWLGIPFPAVIGFVVSAALGLWLVVSIIRTRSL